MKNELFANISQIIERDTKSSTYKFALLRGVIDIIKDNSPYIRIDDQRAYMPLGLLIEKWLLYYYPILESNIKLPQIHGESTKLAFETYFQPIIQRYRDFGGYSVFYNDLRQKGVPENISYDFIRLIKKINYTITKMPMKYIGRSVSDEYYSIFQFDNKRFPSNYSIITSNFLTKAFGEFSIPKDYYEVFRLLGSFISGQDSILYKWAEFSVNASGNTLSMNDVLSRSFQKPITERDVLESKKIYASILDKAGTIHCVWTGKRIVKYDVDHMIPFSVMMNNDLWNLFPASSPINRQKKDKIPSPSLIEKQQDQILHYWHIVEEKQKERFEKEVEMSLLGRQYDTNWESQALFQLQNTCNYFIKQRGYEEWTI